MTLRYVWGPEQAISAFAAALIPHCRRGFGKNVRTLGVVDENDELIAAVIYHNYDPEAGIIEISGAATHPRWLTRQTLREMYHYPFITSGCQMIVQRTPADDHRLLRILAAYGYRHIPAPRLFGRERDGVISLLTVEDWQANKFNRRRGVEPAQAQEAA